MREVERRQDRLRPEVNVCLSGAENETPANSPPFVKDGLFVLPLDQAQRAVIRQCQF